MLKFHGSHSWISVKFKMRKAGVKRFFGFIFETLKRGLWMKLIKRILDYFLINL